MSWNRLPLECLQLIMRQFAHTNDSASLARLLQVDRRTHEATLPFLYNEPLTRARSSSPQYLAHHYQMLALLLRSVPRDLHTNDLRAVFGPEGKEIYSSPSGILPDDRNYLAHLRRFCLDSRTPPLKDCIFQNQTLSSLPSLEKYIQEKGLDTAYHARQLPLEFNSFSDPENVVKDYFAVDIERQLTWAIYFPILEQIQSITLPLSDIQRYLDYVHRFESLSSVVFKMDEKLEYPEYWLRSMEEEGSALPKKLQEKRAAMFEGMIKFVREHTILFKNQLRTATCPDHYAWSGCSQKCPNEYQFLLMKAMPSLKNPVALNETNWLLFAAKTKETNLELVKTIKAPRDHERWLSRLIEQGPFLQRCRALESLEMPSLGRDTFQWALEECQTPIGERSLPLVPLKNISVSFVIETFGQEVDDIALAFDQTLESLTVQGWTSPVFQHAGLSDFKVGSRWHLPHLRHLAINTRYLRLIPHPGLLSDCPSLETIYLQDMGRYYQSDEIRFSAPAALPLLKFAKFHGHAALSFHPETLRSTILLRELELEMTFSDAYCFIPPVDELDLEPVEMDEDSPWPVIPRPIWAWDWDLPLLEKLTLSAEFAYRFQFKMLQKCPSLQFLSLNSSSQSGQHPRFLSEADLLAPCPSDGGHSLDQDLQRRYIFLEKLVDFRLCGQWNLADATLGILLNKVMPNLQSLLEQFCTGFSLQGWAAATGGCSQLIAATSSLRVTAHTATESGLEPYQPQSTRMVQVGFGWGPPEEDRGHGTLFTFSNSGTYVFSAQSLRTD